MRIKEGGEERRKKIKITKENKRAGSEELETASTDNFFKVQGNRDGG